MTVIFEIEHHLWLDASCQNQNLGKPVGRKNLAGRPKAMSIWHWVNEINTPTTSPYRYMYFDCSSLQLSVLSYEKQHWVNDINTNNQPMWSLIVRASSYRNYLICCEKQLDTGTGKLGKLCSGKKASRRKWKSENETENPNTSYLAIITEK